MKVIPLVSRCNRAVMDWMSSQKKKRKKGFELDCKRFPALNVTETILELLFLCKSVVDRYVPTNLVSFYLFECSRSQLVLIRRPFSVKSIF